MRIKSMIFAAVLSLTMVGLPRLVQAIDSYMTAFNGLYKINAGNPLHSCKVCHTTIPMLNSYGKAFLAKHNGAVTVKEALKLIQPLDSDKDGFTNLAEIKAATFPGKAPSHPAAIAGTVSNSIQTTLPDQGEPAFTTNFRINECDFATRGSNDFFILQPGYQLLYEGVGNGTKKELSIAVTNETRFVGTVETRVVEEIRTENEQVVEMSRNYFAICKETNSVFYFGKDTDLYDADGQVTGHTGSWLAGTAGAQAGIAMPGTILLGSRYFQEIAPGIALDRAEAVSMTELVSTPADEFKDCLKTEETTELEPGVVDSKWYAPGVGLVSDNTLQLIRIMPASDYNLEAQGEIKWSWSGK